VTEKNAQTMATTIATTETTTVKALVTLSVVPRAGQTPEAAALEMMTLFREYLTVPDNTFMTDYGASAEQLVAFHADPDEEPTWGGYEGPFVLESKVEAA